MSTPFFIDTHCHLSSESLHPHLKTILANAKQAGVGKIINISCSPTTVEMVLEQIQQEPMLVGALGIHPQEALSFTEEEGLKIKEKAQQNKKIVAIGEIGLDAYYDTPPVVAQIPCFEFFLDMACALSLPVVIHVREAHRDVLELLRRFVPRGLHGVIHCFTRTKEEARDFLNCGFYISFAGVVTFKNARHVKESAQFVPSDRLLIETDAPYLAPMPHRGKQNEPQYVVHTCHHIAELRGISIEECAHITTQNACRLFNLNLEEK
jgi:TatD DNase family protein